MKFGLAMTALSVFVLSSSQRCKPTEEQKREQCNPAYIVNQNFSWTTTCTYLDREICIHEKEYSDEYYGGYKTIDIIEEKIKEIETFDNIDKNKTASENFFTYNMERSVLMWGRATHTMVFYDDGYVTVDSSYYYQFDIEKATSLFDMVDQIYQTEIEIEEDKKNISEEYNAIVDNYTIQDAITDLENQQSLMQLKLYYFESRPSVRYSNFAFEDKDGEFLNLIKAIELTEPTNEQEGSSYSRYHQYEANDTTKLVVSFNCGEKDNWTLTFNENYNIVYLYRAKYDKYDRLFYTAKFYTIEQTSFKAIMDKAFEVKDAQNVEE